MQFLEKFTTVVVEEKSNEIEIPQETELDIITITTVTVSSTSIIITLLLLISNTESPRRSLQASRGLSSRTRRWP